jgi:hypothetical protein
LIGDNGREEEICQCVLEVNARNKAEAAELAKKDFCKTQGVSNWLNHADRMDVKEARPDWSITVNSSAYRVQRCLVLMVGMFGLSASAALAADPNHGAVLAKRWCASCHLVEGDQRLASADVLPFATIARRSDFNAEKVAFFLLDPHPKMPNFPLSRNEAGDIAAYIGSLRK